MKKSLLQISQTFCPWKLQIRIERLESRMNYGFLEPEAHYILWILSASPAPLLIPSLSHPWNCSERKASLLGKQWSFSFVDREFLGRPDSCASKTWLRLACCTFLWVIFDHSFIGVILKESLQWQLSLRRMNVHIADLKKTTLHWINAMLST